MATERENQIITVGMIKALQHMTLISNTRGWLQNVGINLRSGRGKRVTEFDLPADRKKDTIFIIGPGASMSQYREELPKLRDIGTIIMQPTAYPWMHRIGLEPDVIVSVDHMPKQVELIRGATCPVICPTTIDQGMAEEHDVYFFMLYLGDGTAKVPTITTPEGREMLDPGITGDDWYQANWNHIMHYMHKYALTAAGWTSAMDVTNMCVKIAVDLMTGEGDLPNFGAKRIVIVGADRCFWNGYGRVPWEGDELPKYTPDERHVVYRGVSTDHVMVFYVYALYDIWRAFPIPLYRLDHGIMHEIPFVSMDQILKAKYPPALGVKQIHKRTKKWLVEDFANVIPYLWAGPEEINRISRQAAEWRAGNERKWEPYHRRDDETTTE